MARKIDLPQPAPPSAPYAQRAQSDLRWRSACHVLHDLEPGCSHFPLCFELLPPPSVRGIHRAGPPPTSLPDFPESERNAQEANARRWVGLSARKGSLVPTGVPALIVVVRYTNQGCRDRAAVPGRAGDITVNSFARNSHRGLHRTAGSGRPGGKPSHAYA